MGSAPAAAGRKTTFSTMPAQAPGKAKAQAFPTSKAAFSSAVGDQLGSNPTGTSRGAVVMLVKPQRPTILALTFGVAN